MVITISKLIEEKKEVVIIFILFLLFFIKVYFNSFFIVFFYGILILLFLFVNIFFHIQNFPKTIFLLSVYGIWCYFTVVWSELPLYTVIKSSFYLVVLNGALISGYSIKRESFIKYFDNFLKVLILLLIIFAVFPTNNYTIFDGNFRGYKAFFNHSNHLGNALFFLIMLSFFLKNKLTFLEISLLIFLVSSYNRTVMLLLGGWFIFMFLLEKEKQYLNYLLILGGIIFFHYIFLECGIKDYLNKGRENIYISRISVFESSLKSINDNFFIMGHGYGLSEKSNKYDFLNNQNVLRVVTREKGSSVLAIIEETGIIGFFIFFCSFLFFIKKNNFKPSLKRKIFVFFIITFLHSQLENWLIGPNSIMFFVFFFIVGLSIEQQKLNTEISGKTIVYQ